MIEQAGGVPVLGFRAPYFSIPLGVHWPIEVLTEAGFFYDSSVLAIDRPPGLELICPRAPFRHANGLWEVPVGIFQMFHFWHLPLASGNGLRLLPARLFERLLKRFENDVGPCVFYLHPWELDSESPTVGGASRWFLRVGRKVLAERLAALLRSRSFAPICEVFELSPRRPVALGHGDRE